MQHKTSPPNMVAILFAQQALNEALLAELRIGETEDSLIYAPAADALRGALAIEFSRQLGGAENVRKALLARTEPAAAHVYRQYVEQVKNARHQYGDDLVVVELGKELAPEAVLLEVMGATTPERERVQHADPTARAYLLAKLNVQRAKARCFALEYLVDQLPDSKRVHESDLGKALTSLYLCLGTRIACRTVTQMKFAMLLGGSPLEETRQEMVRSSFGPGMDVMGYLTFDERRPTSHSEHDKAAFRASIDRHLRRMVR